jgi:23S rRNA-/tRNA-specific pseudouridylate synthase
MKKLPRKARSRSGESDCVSAHEDRRRPCLSRELSVLYEDNAVVVLDKPAGLLAVPIKGSDTPSALSLLVASIWFTMQGVLSWPPHSTNEKCPLVASR